MAKDLHNLIQIHEFEVDEKRRKLGELFRLMANLEAQAKALEEELVREQDMARGNPEEAGHLYGAYAETVIERRERLRESMVQMNVAIEESREELRLSFMELKKYEIAQENRDRKAAAELSRRERMDMDEIGLQSHRKRKLAG